jgi:hypothetical protein
MTSVGLEEEYFLADAETKSVARGMPVSFSKGDRASRPSMASPSSSPFWQLRLTDAQGLFG